MRLPDVFASQPFAVSIEIFPPKTPAGDDALRRHMRTLAEHKPAFMSCTYGAGGSTRDRTLSWCREIQDDFERPSVAHFTCVGSTREELNRWLDEAEAAGVRNIMALRGDSPEGQGSFEAVAGGLRYANELVELIQQHNGNFGIGVAGYPEKHMEAPSLEVDLQNLKRKVDAGADAVFTQLFFDNEKFFVFRDQCEKLGISLPLVPGIMPITDFARIKRITAMCGTAFPKDLAARLEAVQDDKEAQFEIGVEYAISQCNELRSSGVPGIHFYALNKSQACQKILSAL
ncbi:MAG: methylenetetrahydrofolate reductase [NAD(P)H] [Fuerstiella sp.]|jgi:methylenetetrahydrofolate reductase (NADPH)|nr:methylenetetrahydrofolate reductase [NAD(P)H] [Fuerstiella sp.]MDG2131061.1 methylenetetrahydrofolate reductase [NAD(P)H] [Fuerstiella sp.]